MSRKSIFQRIVDNKDYGLEIKRIENLLKCEGIVKIEHTNLFGAIYYENYNIEKFVDSFIFLQWEHRLNCLNTKDMRCALDIDRILKLSENANNIDVNSILDYLEYAINILVLVNRVNDSEVKFKLKEDAYEAALKNIKNILNELNYEAHFIDKNSCILLVEKNPAATAVAEIVDENIADDVIQYNHYLLKGDIETKKKILNVLGTKLEPQRTIISSLNSKLETNIFFMLNNLNIRHNNCDDNDKGNINNLLLV